MTTTPDLDQQRSLLRFARAVYSQPGLQALCLRLQDEQNVDVVLLLMCCWHGCYQGLLSDAQLEQAAAFSGTWATELVKPLRQSRRWLKAHPAVAMGIPDDDQEDLRQLIKAMELEAEFMQLRALAGLFPEPASVATDPATTVPENLARYARYRALDMDSDTLDALTRASIHCI